MSEVRQFNGKEFSFLLKLFNTKYKNKSSCGIITEFEKELNLLHANMSFRIVFDYLRKQNIAIENGKFFNYFKFYIDLYKLQTFIYNQTLVTDVKEFLSKRHILI